ncbi:hypothetical protein BCF46_3293 [Litoreibacter meonggei]|uniref:Uncharacterized protein n=1 Tax=Litoreibacter meonggei TaxID=1049199 RepID=A0A497VV38_9RHOB|nr:hypothetical protein [Litoreibacter meonggei]RLJ40723.1 hypothetical protein BCF46_3293 [Litoreibacter meonggei]
MSGASLTLSACGTPYPDGPPQASKAEVDALAASIAALGAHVDPVEAARAARIAYDYPLQLAQQYRITDTPLAHNRKVNRGQRPRGLCWHWAEDLQARLAQEQFKTLDLHRAIANGLNPILISHSTVLISAKGDDMYDAIVLDPWRDGGRLFWSKTREDKRYNWYPRLEILAERRRRRLAYEGNL